MIQGEGMLLQSGGDWFMHFERHFAHSVHKVWDAITGPGQMSHWFDETHMPDPLALGANIRFVHGRYGAESRGEITALDAPRLIEWLWISDFGPASRMGWEIEADGDGARLILNQHVTDEATVARTMAGWHKCLDRMQAMLDGGAAPEEPTWQSLFETVYIPRVAAVGVATPQAGAPEPKTTS